MSNALKNVVDSGTSTLSDLVDEARSMIEDLPPIANRRKQSRKNWSSLLVVAFLVFVAAVAAKQLRHRPTESAPESTTL